MNKTRWNSIVDALSFGCFVLLTSTGLVLRYVLPPGSGNLIGQGTGRRAAERPITLLWGFTGHQWGQLHFWIAVVLMAALTLHLVLHWRWIVAVVKGQPREESGTRAGLGLMGLAALLVLSAAPFLSPAEKVTRGELQAKVESSGPVASQPKIKEAETIRGDMTLSEVEHQTSVPLSHLKGELKLPATVSGDERLGQLRRRYGFAVEDVRQIVERYKKSHRSQEEKPCDDAGVAPCTEIP